MFNYFIYRLNIYITLINAALIEDKTCKNISFSVDTAHSGTRRSIIVAITVACLSFVAMVIAVAIVIYLLKFKRRASYDEHTSFENRIFQVLNNHQFL